MISVEIIVVLLAILVGTRLKGMSLGMMGGLGLAVLTFGFGLRPTEPPVQVLMIITAVVTAAGTLEAAGGLHYLTNLAESIIRKYPNRITYISPIVVYLFTFLGGTGHTVYSLLPVIGDVAKEVGVRPERPLSMAVIASQQAAIASPISAPTAIIVGILAPEGIELIDILKICIPATIIGLMVATLVVNRLGKELHEDSDYLKRIQAEPTAFSQQEAASTRPLPPSAKRSVWLFMLSITVIILLGSLKSLRPRWERDGIVELIAMPSVIEIVMLSIAALIVLLCKVNPQDIVKSKVFTAGMQAVIAIMGISWLGDTFISAHKTKIVSLVQTQIMQAPWQFSIILFCMSIILVSQSATMRSLVPLGLTLGIPASALLAALPAVNGLFFIPNYPTVLAAVSLDRTGTTHIGKWVLNHSFMIPGLISTATAVLVAHGLVYILF